MRKASPTSLRRISPTSFRVANRGTSREINRQIALNLIRFRQPLSRADLARLMGVRRGAITRIVDDLLDAGLVYEGEKGPSERGRKPLLLYLDTRRHCAIAVDVSATRTFIMVTDLLGASLGDVRTLPTCSEPTALVEELAHGVRQILAERPVGSECVGMGVVVSGVVDSAVGRLKFSPTLGWRDADLAGPLSAATGMPVVVENSCKACVLAQVWGARADTAADGPVAFVNISDGVGVGIAVDGKLLRGAHDLAGEVGHVTLDPAGPLCSCGQRGCWESFVSRRAVLARYLGADPSWPESATRPGPSVEAIIERAVAGEAQAVTTIKETAQYLGRGIAVLCKTVDPHRVYLGGDLTRAWDMLRPGVLGVLQRESLIRAAGPVEILIVPREEHPRLRGAAALVSTAAFAAPIVA